MIEKVGIWRHEGSIGNSIEHTINATKEQRKNTHYYVETEMQKQFVKCAGVPDERIHFFPKELVEYKDGFNYNHPYFNDIRMPNCYPFPRTYAATWKHLVGFGEQITFRFDDKGYHNTLNLPKDAVVVQFRERSGYAKRHEGANSEPERFVDPSTFHKLIDLLLYKGYNVIRLGDSYQKPFKSSLGPRNGNGKFFDVAKADSKSIQDDLFAIQNCRLFISTDSGIWPIVGAMKKTLLLTNITSVFRRTPPKMEIVDWLPEETTKLLFKDKKTFKDNALEEVWKLTQKMLNKP